MSLCLRCQKLQARPEMQSCEQCAASAREYEARKARENPVGTCSKCRKRPNILGFKQCAECRVKQAASMMEWRSRQPDKNAAYLRKRNKARREQVIAHYGGECACCGESTYEFMAIDHIEGGGTEHRRTTVLACNLISWLIKSNYPEGFRVLCHNCNSAIGFYGACPHAVVLAE